MNLEYTADNIYDEQADVIVSVEEDAYPQIVSSILEYVGNYRKENGNTDSLIHIIIEFSIRNNYSVDVIADIIKKDNSLKKLLKLDCVNNNIIKEEKVTESLDKW